MEHYRNRISIQGKKQRSGSSRRTVENDPLNHSTGTDPNYSEPAIAKENDHDMHNFVQALKTIHGVPIEHVEQLLLGHNTACSTIELCGQERVTKWAESINWQEQYKILEQKHEDLQQKFNKIDSEMQALTKLQEKEDQKHEHEQERGRHWQVEYEKLEMRYQDLQRHFDQQKMMVEDKIKIEIDHETLKSMFSNKEQELLNEKSEKSQLLQLVKQLDTESKSYQAQLQEKESQLKKQREEMKKVYTEKDYVMSSQHMGQQMSEGNPNITDLSDPNRPSKLGQRYSELYDNEWTNAFEVLTDKFGKDDKDAVDVLRNILWKSYASAFDISRTQIEDAEHKLSGSSKAVSPECKRLLKEAQKHINIRQADDLIENALQRTIMKDIEMKYPNETPVHVFAKECFQLCWLMSIQDPPVVLVEDPTMGNRFDTNIYRHYIHSGDTVDYVVWPALLLHKDGPVLTKGVAQPTPRCRPKSAFSFGENKKTNERTSDKFTRSLSVRKVEEKPSPSDRRNQDDSAVQWDSSCQKKMDNHPTETRTYTGRTAATQRRTAYPMQFGINQTFVDDKDAEQFSRFCTLYPSYSEQAMRQTFGSNFNRYYELFIFKTFGNHTSA